MKIVTSLFTAPKDVISAVRQLIEHGYSRDDLSMMASAADMPDYLEGDPEAAASQGAALGAAAGGSIGALGSVVASTIPGFESMFVSGLMATTVGGVLGGYLGSLFSVRAESQTELDLHEALEAGKILLVVQTKDKNDLETAVSLLEQNNGEHIETHTVDSV